MTDPLFALAAVFVAGLAIGFEVGKGTGYRKALSQLLSFLGGS